MRFEKVAKLTRLLVVFLISRRLGFQIKYFSRLLHAVSVYIHTCMYIRLLAACKHL